MTNQKKLLRKVEIGGVQPPGKTLGVFHRWCHEPFWYSTVGGVTQTLALVEFTDGSVRFIEPAFVKFLEPPEDDNPFTNPHGYTYEEQP